MFVGVRERSAEEQVRGRLHPWEQRALHLHAEAKMIRAFFKSRFAHFSKSFPAFFSSLRISISNTLARMKHLQLTNHHR